MVVLPHPGGPHRIMDDKRPAATMRPSGPSGPSRWSWPTTSARVCGRRRSANGWPPPLAGPGWRLADRRRRKDRSPGDPEHIGLAAAADGEHPEPARAGASNCDKSSTVLTGLSLTVCTTSPACRPMLAAMERPAMSVTTTPGSWYSRPISSASAGLRLATVAPANGSRPVSRVFLRAGTSGGAASGSDTARSVPSAEGPEGGRGRSPAGWRSYSAALRRRGLHGR